MITMKILDQFSFSAEFEEIADGLLIATILSLSYLWAFIWLLSFLKCKKLVIFTCLSWEKLYRPVPGIDEKSTVFLLQFCSALCPTEFLPLVLSSSSPSPEHGITELHGYAFLYACVCAPSRFEIRMITDPIVCSLKEE